MKTYYIHPAAFGSTDPGYGHVPVVKADEAEKRVADLEVVKELFLRAKALMYQSGGTPIENSLNPIDAWLYDAERAASMLQGAEPVTTAYKLPEGWVAVPIEPTEDMIVNGFESEPDESFSDAEVWEAYDAMSGCQQAAHRAKLCWAAMIAAAPKPEA